MLELRRAADRGHAQFGWLDSRHSFSFGSYFDPRFMGVSALRVLNDDRVAPGAGFDTHGHRDMEIISYVLEGSLAHRDSLGHEQHLPAGEFQLMTAGTGVSHSEFNPSATEPVHFLQIWLLPERAGLAPGYQQRRFPEQPGLQRVAGPAGDDAALLLHQDAHLYHLRLGASESIELPLAPPRVAYLHLITGELTLAGQRLQPGDGATMEQETAFTATATTDVEALLFDLPPHAPLR